MNYKNKALFFILFIFKEFFSSQSIPASFFQYDITKVVDQWFNKLLNTDPDIDKLMESFTKAQNYTLDAVEYILNRKIEPFGMKLLFKDVHFYQSKADIRKTSKISQITWNKPQNKICELFDDLQITARAKLHARCNETGHSFYTTLNFHNFTFCCISSLSSSTKNRSIDYDISYNNYFLRNYAFGGDYKWSAEEKGLVTIGTEEITQEIQSALISMLRLSIKRNKNIYQAFNALFHNYTQINEEISAAYNNIDQEPKYYYLIPKIQLYRFTMNIIIHGLPNIESLKIYTAPNIFTRTLLVKNLEGDLVLDYGSRRDGAPAPMELNFKIDYLSISTKRESNCAHVEAKSYGFNSTKGPLNYRQSAFLMPRIESAIVSAIMPSKGVWRLCDIESPIVEPKNIVNSSKLNWKTIRETYKDWIPFPDDEVVKIKIAV